MKKSTLLLSALIVAPLATFLLFSNDTDVITKPIYLHEQISQKTTKAWEPFLNQFIGKGDVVLKFFAYYCGPCKNMAPHIDDLAQEMSECTFVKVQWEMFPGLVTRFGITSIPTLIFLRDGKEIGRYDGGPLSKDELATLILNVYGR